MQNPILTLIKTIAFVVLAFLVLLSFWQETKQEDRTEVLGKRISGIEESVDRLSTAINKLDRRIAKGGIRTTGPVSNGSGGGATTTEVPGPREVETFAWSKEAPSWLKGRAKELWGTYGENYFKPDPNWPAYPDLDDPKLDPEGKIAAWYTSAPPDLNAFTVNESAVNNYIKTYASEYLGEPHTQNPYLYKPGLAFRAEVSPDYKTWIFWLRPGVRWHTPQVDLSKYPHLKGEHYFTTADWKFTMDLVMNEDVRAAHARSYFKGLDRVEVIDDHCMIMHWKKTSFSSISSSLNTVIPAPKFVYGYDENGKPFNPATLSSQINDHWFGKGFKWVGTGPYYLQHFDHEKDMSVRRFDEYWGQLPAIKEVRREIFQKRDLNYTKFEAGEFTYASYLTPDWKKRIKDTKNHKDGKWGTHWAWGSSYRFIAYKNTHKIFRDLKVRHAMTHATDRKRMLQAVNDGQGQIVTGPQSMHAPTYPNDIKPLAYDLDKARKLLEEAGWQDADGNGVLEKEIDGETVEFRVTASTPSAASYTTIFDIFAEDLAKIGVALDVSPLLWAQFLKKLNDRSFEICCLGWDTPGWDGDMGQIWHSDQVEQPESSNFIEFQDPEVDRLIEKARMTFDLKERVKVQSAAHRRVHELQPYTFLFTLKTPVVWWKAHVSDYKDAFQWKLRPFARIFPLYVPVK